MVTVRVKAGACGAEIIIKAAQLDKWIVQLEMSATDCNDVAKMQEELQQVDVKKDGIFKGISHSRVFQVAGKCLKHSASCPIPCAVTKAIEVATGAAVPADASITVEK